MATGFAAAPAAAVVSCATPAAFTASTGFSLCCIAVTVADFTGAARIALRPAGVTLIAAGLLLPVLTATLLFVLLLLDLLAVLLVGVAARLRLACKGFCPAIATIGILLLLLALLVLAGALLVLAGTLLVLAGTLLLLAGDGLAVRSVAWTG
jgi:hypothetical protein